MNWEKKELPQGMFLFPNTILFHFFLHKRLLGLAEEFSF